MKKTVSILTLMMLSLLLTACADRTPFKEQTPLKDTALIYVYIPKTVSTGEESYNDPFSIKIDDKTVTLKLFQSEYVSYDIKPRKLIISAVRAAVEAQEITLELHSDERVYLRVINLDDGTFAFEKIQENRALKEIAKTGVAGSNFIFSDDDKPQGLIETTPNDSKTRTQADEIQRLYEMKEKGILTQDEFETLKAKVISK